MSAKVLAHFDPQQESILEPVMLRLTVLGAVLAQRGKDGKRASSICIENIDEYEEELRTGGKRNRHWQ